MLRITVELVPHGNENLKKKISEMIVYNTGKTKDFCIFKYGWKGYVIDMDGYSHFSHGKFCHNKSWPLATMIIKVFSLFHQTGE